MPSTKAISALFLLFASAAFSQDDPIIRVTVNEVRIGAVLIDQNAIHSPGPSPRLLSRDEGAQPVGSVHQLVIVPDWRSTDSVFGLRLQAAKVPASVLLLKLSGATEKNIMLAYRPASSGDLSVRTFSPGDTMQYLAQIANIWDAAAA